MKSSIKVDRLSVLPQSIIDSILTRLSVKEAVRTGILSRSWIYQWHSLSKININYEDLSQVSHAAFVKIIDHILLSHCGSVDTFDVYITIGASEDIGRWILYVSRHGIKKLIMNKSVDEYYNIPSCIFSCSDLTLLKFTACIFKAPPPPTFKAFSNLKELFFTKVVITDMKLEKILNSCPLLSTLSLMCIHPRPSLKINVPKLATFYIKEFDCYSQFTSTPLLTSVAFGLEDCVHSHNADNKDCEIVELLGSMPILQRLEFIDCALHHLAIGDVPVRLPLVCPIKDLIMHIDFEDSQELLATFCIFRSAPFIQTLEAYSSTSCSRIAAGGFWEGEHDLRFKIDNLQEVELYSFTGTESELKFVKFLLAKAPTLKTMYIGFHSDVEDLVTVFAELNQFPRISPSVAMNLDYP